MNYFSYLILFMFGLAVGSFINVVSLRYQPSQKILDTKIIGGRSHCPHCGKNLAWYELIPLISFFIQKGQCRGCGQKISFQYPLVEFLSGLIFVGVPLALTSADFYIGFHRLIALSVVWIFIFILLLLLSIIDLRYSLIPNQINLTLGILGLILIFINSYYHLFSAINGSFIKNYAALFGLRENILINYLFAALLGMAFFGTIIILSRGKAMGWGDFKLIGALGLIFGWPDILLVMSLAFVIGALVSVVFLIGKKKKMRDAVPFGQFLAISAVLIFFFGYQIVGGYFRLFGL